MSVYCTYVPQGLLAAFVNTLWMYEGDASSIHAKEWRLPHGALELVINLREEPFHVYNQPCADQFQSFRGGVIIGAHSTCFGIDATCLASVMGVNFKPGGAFPFLQLPASELHNAHVSLEALWGTSADEVRERLLAAKTTQARFSILEHALLARASHPLIWHAAIAFALSELQNPAHTSTIAEVTEQIGLSSRRFIELFHEVVGLTPKQFGRIQRFQEVLRLIETGESRDWAAIAIACGYFDQAHLIHEFRAFSGLTPGMYRAQRGEFRNHVSFST